MFQQYDFGKVTPVPHLDIYWSFRSPYSYLAVPRLANIIEQKNVSHSMRFVRPLALREGEFFKKARPQWLPYLFKDIGREAEMLGMAISLPQPDPIAMNLETGDVEADQPLMTRLMKLGFAAEITQSAGFSVANAVSRLIWGGTKNWHEDGHLAAALANIDLSLKSLEDWADSNIEAIKNGLAANERDQLVHHWGVPLMVLDGEPFFGQDRLDTVKWRLDKIDA